MFSIKESSTKNGSRSNKPNQDAFSKWFINDDLSTPNGFMGVYDGHGEFGKYYSNYIKEYFDTVIPLHWDSLNSDFKTVIHELYYTLLTKDHSPSSLEEYTRVQTNYDTPGIFYYSQGNSPGGPTIFTTDIDGNYVKRDPYMLYRKYPRMYHKNVEGEFATYFSKPSGTIHQLSVLRSFGDFDLIPVGLSCVPDIVEHRFSENTIILLASDGLWDNWKKKELFEQFKNWLSMGMSFIDIYTLVFTLTGEKAQQNFGNQRDDITAILFSKTF
jgi:serine/threonine protein phosphatase PrpC